MEAKRRGWKPSRGVAQTNASFTIKSTMTRKRPFPQRSCRVRFTAAISICFLTVALFSMICIARLASLLTTEVMGKEGASGDQPHELSSPTTLRRSLAKQNRTKEEQHRHYRYKLGLVRVVGNPIPPINDKARTLRNLEFVLEHEPKFETTVDKHWILNRIADDEFLEHITRRLIRYNQAFSVLPFDIREYDSKPYRYEKASKKILGDNWKNREVDLLRSRFFWVTLGENSMTEKERQRRIYFDELYKEKQLYVTNRNNARNFAMGLYTDGEDKKETEFTIDYVLPWDGDCFLSQSAHDMLHRDLEQHNDEQQERIAAARINLRREMQADDDSTNDLGSDDDFIDNEISNAMTIDSPSGLLNAPINYFYTPMEQRVISDNVKTVSNEEPLQFVFHRTARARFDKNGINKVYMLQKLHIKGSWNKGNATYPYPRDYNYHPCILGQGSNDKETSHAEDCFASLQRGDLGTPAVGSVSKLISGELNLGNSGGTSQREGLALFCRSLDERAVNQMRYNEDNEQLEQTTSSYLFYNQAILEKEARDYGRIKESKEEEYPESFDNLVRRLIDVADSLLKHGTYKKPSIYTRRSVAEFQSDSTVLGLAYELTGEMKYAKQAAENIRSWLVNPSTRLHRMGSIDHVDSSLLQEHFNTADLEEISAFGLAYEWTGDTKYVSFAAVKVTSWFSNPHATLEGGWNGELSIGSVPRPDLSSSDFEDISTLGSAYESTGDEKYARKALEHIQSWFLTPERSRLSVIDFEDIASFLEEATAVKLSDNDSVSRFTLLDFKDIPFFLDALKMVEKSGVLSESEIASVREWFQFYLDGLIQPGSDFGNAAYYENDYRGLYYDIQLISIAAFTGNHNLAVQSAHESLSRLIGHANKFERAVESVETDCEEDLLLLLQGWMTLARIVSNYFGIQLWKELPLKRLLYEDSKRTKEQPFLCRAPEYAVHLYQQDRYSCGIQNSTTGSDARWLPIHLGAQPWDCPPPWKVSEDGISRYSAEPLFAGSPAERYNGYGIAPFWNLGLA